MALQIFTAGQTLTAAQMTSLQANTYNQTVSTKTASYTLVAADVGTRIVMNSASATTITVNTSLFSAGDTLFIQNIGAGVCTVTAGTATVSSAGPLAIPQNGSGLLYFTSAGVSIFYPSAVTASAGGLTCVKAETSFSASSSVTADSILTSSYTNYLVIVNWQTAAAQNLYMRLRIGGVSTSTNYNSQDLIGTGTTTSAQRFTGATEWMIGQSSGGAFNSTTILNIYQPQVATVTTMTANIIRNNGNYTTGLHAILTTGNQTDSTQFDGIQLLPSGGTITGNYAVYGYSKTV